MKDILVHLDGTAADDTRIAHAGFVVGLFEAHLTGLLTNIMQAPVMPVADGMAYAVYLESIQEKTKERGDRDAERLAHRLDAVTASSELRRLDIFSEAVWQVVAMQARASDLLIALRPYGSERDEGQADVVEAGLFESGRAVYVAPEGAAPPAALQSVLIGWNDTPAAAHAIAEAMPFLRKAGQVVVVTVDEREAAEQAGEEPGADIARHLDRHGINVELRHVAGWSNTSDALLNEVERTGADLAVLGAYGHSRLREWVLGGTTRDCLTRCPVPIIMAH
ncbi:universal stress protein [Chelatococcus asaccharovorans]|uniref:Universal stress protein family protein n=1 Tax=Chelatococcus asaccharovorans TaxID=28210 RepID=A0A2V3TUL8_9HYPH|nr:universal stress protein [Chelatococcus asaccharovorans]MBS7706070.1 universal stress protein [Chelatococcus asaccharovorans]PXW52439.1 universal stress protein family protein [Chelatococcus asaccharovorans]